MHSTVVTGSAVSEEIGSERLRKTNEILKARIDKIYSRIITYWTTLLKDGIAKASTMNPQEQTEFEILRNDALRAYHKLAAIVDEDQPEAHFQLEDLNSIIAKALIV